LQFENLPFPFAGKTAGLVANFDKNPLDIESPRFLFQVCCLLAASVRRVKAIFTLEQNN